MKEHAKKTPIEGYVSFLLISLIVAVMGLEVFSRTFFSYSFRWTVELSRYLFIWFIFISASYAVIENSHIRIEAFSVLFPEKIRVFLEMLGNIIWFAFSIFVAYIGFTYSIELLMGTNISAAMRIPIGLVYISIPIGYVLMALRLLQQGYKNFKGNKTADV